MNIKHFTNKYQEKSIVQVKYSPKETKRMKQCKIFAVIQPFPGNKVEIPESFPPICIKSAEKLVLYGIPNRCCFSNAKYFLCKWNFCFFQIKLRKMLFFFLITTFKRCKHCLHNFASNWILMQSFSSLWYITLFRCTVCGYKTCLFGCF